MLNKRIFKKGKKMSPMMWVLFSVLVIYTISVLLLLVWGFMTSIKSIDEFDYNKVWPAGADGLDFENYLRVFKNFYVPISSSTAGTYNVYVETLLLNTILYAGMGALIKTFVPCFVAYLTSKYTYKFSSVIYWIVVVTMALPIIGADSSMIEFMRRAGIFDSFLGNWIQKFNFLGMYFLVFHAMFKSMPNAYREAATIDGAGETTVCFKIYFPLALKTFFMVFVVGFMDLWNDYQTALLYLPTNPTLAVGVYSLTNSKLGEFNNVPMRMATCFVVLIPILALFMAFKDKFMGSLSMGGVKG